MAATQEQVTVGGRTIDIGPQQAYYLLDDASVATKKLKLVAVGGSVGHAVVCGGVGERIRLDGIDELVETGRLVRAEQYDGATPGELRA